MRKVKLELESLHVDTFQTTPAEPVGRGTVQGHYSQVGTCDAFVGTCQYGGSCGPGCARTRYPCTI